MNTITQGKLGQRSGYAKSDDSHYQADMTVTRSIVISSASLIGALMIMGAGVFVVPKITDSEPAESQVFDGPSSFEAALDPDLFIEPEESVDLPLEQVTVEDSPAFIPVDTVESMAQNRPRMAVIIDDMGLNATLDSEILALNYPVTASILPYAERSESLAQAALDAGHTVFVHLPMEPGGLEDPGPYAITSGQSQERLASVLEWAFARVPGATGFNNHMGSRLTRSQSDMITLFNVLPDHVTYFVDSLTHADSLAASIARQSGLRTDSRDVFLDHETSDASLDQALENVLQTAERKGSAILIAHPRPASLERLRRLGRDAEARGIEIVAVTEIMDGSNEAPGL